MTISPLDGFVLYKKPAVTKGTMTMRACHGGISFTKKCLDKLGSPAYVNIFLKPGRLAVCAADENAPYAFELAKGEGSYRGLRSLYYRKILDDIAEASDIPRDEIEGFVFPGKPYEEYVIFDLTKGAKGERRMKNEELRRRKRNENAG